MARGRIISSGVWEDDWFGCLTVFERLLWIGLFSACADDQGRFLLSSSVIRARVFPYDDTALSTIEDCLAKFVSDGKIARYVDDNKTIGQLVAWWEHQSPSWSSPSRYNPPSGWVDRLKYHTAGNKIVSKNWDTLGGYCELPSPLPSDLPRGIKEDERKGKEDERKGKEDERKGEEVDDNDDFSAQFGDLEQAFLQATSLPIHSGGVPNWIESFVKLKQAGVLPEDITVAVGELREREYSIVGPRSIVNPAMIAMSKRLKPGKGKKGYDPGTEEELEIARKMLAKSKEARDENLAA